MFKISLNKNMLAVLIVSALIFHATADTFKPEKYQEIDPAELKTSPDSFKGKKITYATRLWSYRSQFPEYMEKSGFKPGRYYQLLAYPRDVPVMAKIKGLMDDKISDIKKNSLAVIYGEVDKFKWVTITRYYLELDHIEIIDPEDKSPENQEKLKKILEKLKKDVQESNNEENDESQQKPLKKK